MIYMTIVIDYILKVTVVVDGFKYILHRLMWVIFGVGCV